MRPRRSVNCAIPGARPGVTASTLFTGGHMQLRLTQWLTIGTAAVAMACATQPPVVTTSTTRTTTTTSTGDIVLNSTEGWWVDSVGGTWIDTTGVLWRGGRSGVSI